MRIRLIHPLWTHIPAVAVFIAMIVYISAAGSLPAEAPVHFKQMGPLYLASHGGKCSLWAV
jgi:hypothetical protein